MRNQIVVLAGGKGTRMGQQDIPKVLTMLNNKPIIMYLLEELEKIGQLATPVIVVGYRHTDVMGTLGDGYTYALQKDQLGTGHALMCAEPRVNADNILVLYGDMPFVKAESLKKLMRLHLSQHAEVSMFTTFAPNFDGEYESFKHFGRIIRDPQYGNIIKITEYKDASESEKEIREVNPGIYMFSTAWLWSNIHHLQNDNTQKEFYLTDLIELAMIERRTIQNLSINPKEVFGINTLEHLSLAEAFLQE